MIGLQFIADTYQLEYKKVGELVGVSKQTCQDWIKGRRKIPKPRLEALSEVFGIKELEWFQKELTDAEKTAIQLHYYQHSDKIEVIEEEQVDQEGYRYKVTYQVSQNQPVIEYLKEKVTEEKIIERVVQVINCNEAGGQYNQTIIQNVLKLLEEGGKQQKILELVVYALLDQGNEGEYGVHPRFEKYYERGFFTKFNQLLDEYKLLD